MYRSRSILRLILVGFAVVLAPMTAAVVTAVVQVDRLSEAGRAAVLEAETATQQSRSLIEQLTEMQRAFGQFRVLGDTELYQNYVERRAIFRNAVDNLLGLALPERAIQQLTAIEREEAVLFSVLSGGDTGDQSTHSATDTAQLWRILIDRAREVLSDSSQLIETQANYATDAADRLQRLLLLQAAAVVPVTFVLAGVFVVLITRPTREIAKAIQRLGARELDEVIEVRGPDDLAELGKELDWLRRRIKELEHQQITFLRHISHELKTPLATIREGAELLAESLSDGAPEDAELSSIMRSSSLRLQKLIEDLLQFGKTQELISDLKITQVDLGAVLRAAVSTQALAIGSKNITLAEDLSDARVRGDGNKLRIVIENLLNNAVKYTPVNGRVSISLEKRGNDVVIDVRDSGPGVLDTERQAIFEPFHRGQAEYQSSVKGTGLGLAIAKEYVETHDGCIEVVDSGGGAHFRVVLPVAGPNGQDT
ncbi:MAG TPA: HAMP domain-containing sensor histidine kinase [Gammaproteobacteria bacterium]